MGFGLRWDSVMRDPYPPAKMTTFMSENLLVENPNLMLGVVLRNMLFVFRVPLINVFDDFKNNGISFVKWTMTGDIVETAKPQE